MSIPLLGCAAAAFLIGGFLLVLITRLAERYAGPSAATATLVGGFIMLAAAVAAGWLGDGWLGRVTAIAAAGLLVLALVVYILYRIERARGLAQFARTRAPAPGRNCRSRLEAGSATANADATETWRSYLGLSCGTNPSNGELAESLFVIGSGYFGFFYEGGLFTLTPSLKILCLPNEDGTCLADASENGNLSRVRSVVRAQILNSVPPTTDKRVRVTVTMAAALNASGGPTFSALPGGIGFAASFPDASLEFSFAMGTYRWICEKAKEEPAERVGMETRLEEIPVTEPASRAVEAGG